MTGCFGLLLILKEQVSIVERALDAALWLHGRGVDVETLEGGNGFGTTLATDEVSQ